MLTRRELISRAARTGGYGAAFLAMRSLDLLAAPLDVTTPFQMPPNVGRGTTVAILGAGIAGLVAAYEGPYKEFLKPDDRIYFAGDYCSHLTTWQEGAALAGQRAVEMIVKRVRDAV
jgi:hypothetical protein